MNIIYFFLHLTDDQHRRYFYRRMTRPAEKPIQSLKEAIIGKHKIPCRPAHWRQRLLINTCISYPDHEFPSRERISDQRQRIEVGLAALYEITEDELESLKGLKEIPIPNWRG